MRNIFYTALTLIAGITSANTLLAKNSSSALPKNTISNASTVSYRPSFAGNLIELYLFRPRDVLDRLSTLWQQTTPKISTTTPLSDFAKQLLTPNTTTLAPEKNIMVGILGLGAPLNQDPLIYAKSILAFEINKAQQTRPKNYLRLINPSNFSLAWQGDIDQLCDFSRENCFSKIKDQDSIYQTLAQDNKVSLARYQALLSLEKSAYVLPQQYSAAIPNYKHANNANRLALYQIGKELLSEQNDLRMNALTKLHTELKLWINIAKSEPTSYFAKSPALRMIHRHLRLIGEYALQQKQLTVAEYQKIHDILKDLDQREIWDMRSAYYADYQAMLDNDKITEEDSTKVFNGIAQLMVDELNNDCSHDKPFTAESIVHVLSKQYFDGNQISNTHARVFQKQDQVLTLPKHLQASAWKKINRTFPNAAEIKKFDDALLKNKCLLLSNTKKINIFGKTLYDESSVDFSITFVQTANDHQAYFNLIRAIVAIKEKNLLPSQIASFLKNNKSNYQHPASLANIEFDEKTQTFQIPLTTREHSSVYSNFKLVWR